LTIGIENVKIIFKIEVKTMKKREIKKSDFLIGKHSITYKKKNGKYIESKPIRIGKSLLKEKPC